MPTLTLTPKSISQAKLSRFAELKQLTAELEVLRKEIVALAAQNLPCQPGRYVLKVTNVAGQCRPAWKDEAIALASQLGLNTSEWQQSVMDRTPLTEPTMRLEVVDRDNPNGK